MAETTMRLSDLCDFVGVQVDPTNRADDVYIGLEHVATGRFVRIGEGKASDVQSSKYAFQPGDVLYGKLRPYLDKAILADDIGICTTELLVLRPKSGVDPRFVVGVVHAPSFVEHAVAGTTGVQHPRTSWNHIRKYELPVFDFDGQTKIANLLWEVHDAITANEAAIEAGADLKLAAMRTLFTRGLKGEAQKETEIGRVPESWRVVECEDAVEALTVGVVVKPASYYAPSGVPAFRSLNVKEDRIDASSLVFFSKQDNETTLSKSKLRAGDVLVVRTGYPGTSCVVPEEFDGANCIDLVVIRPKQELVQSQFLSRFLNSDFGKSQALSNSHGLAQQHLNVSAVRRLKVPVPPTPNEQREIVAILDVIDRKIELHRRKRAVLSELFKALLHKLMTGEIRVGDLDLSALGTPSTADAAA